MHAHPRRLRRARRAGVKSMAHDLLTHWMLVALTAGLVLYPVGRILGRMGFSSLLAVVALLPFVNLLALWIVAFIDWPKRSDIAP